MKYDIHNLPEEFDYRDLSETKVQELATEIVHYLLLETKWHVDEGKEFGDTRCDQPDEGRSILLTDWNDVPELWQDILEHDGYILEWCDQAVVHEGKVWHLQPQYIGDIPRIRAVDGEWITSDDDPQEWIDSSEMTDYMQEAIALPNWFDEQHLVDAGYEKQNEHEYESGWYEGQTDDPQEIAKTLFENGAESVIFHIPRVGQFDIRFNVWSK